MYSTIRISKKTKDLLSKVLIKLENELGKRLNYDDVIKILIERSGFRNSNLLLKLKEMSVPEEIVKKAHEILERETKFEEEIFKRRYGLRYKYSS